MLGIRWSAADFERGTISINHKVTVTTADRQHKLFTEDKLKTKSSFRTLPLIPAVRTLLEREGFYLIARINQIGDRALERIITKKNIDIFKGVSSLQPAAHTKLNAQCFAASGQRNGPAVAVAVPNEAVDTGHALERRIVGVESHPHTSLLRHGDDPSRKYLKFPQISSSSVYFRPSAGGRERISA